LILRRLREALLFMMIPFVIVLSLVSLVRIKTWRRVLFWVSVIGIIAAVLTMVRA